MVAEKIIADNRNGINITIILLLAVLLYFPHLGKTPIYILDEAKNAQCAREMMQRGDWIVPTFNQELRTDKPPFHYFFMILAYKIFGVNEFAARFFSAIFGIGTLLVTYFFSRKFLGEMKAFFIVLVLLSSLHFTLEMHLSVPDPYLIFLISTGLFSVFTFLQTAEKKYVWLFYSCIGFGILCKGPVAIVVPGLIVLFYLILEKELSLKKLLQLQPFIGLAIVLLLALPWYYAVYKATDGAWVKGFLFEHNINRFMSAKEGHGGFFLLTAIFIFAGFLPFSVFIVQTVKHVKAFWQNPFIKFSALVSVVFLLFFTVSNTKLPNYPMPAYPFYAVLFGSFLHSWTSREYSGSMKMPFIILFILMLAIPVAIYFVLKNEPPISLLANLSVYFIIFPIGAFLGFYFYQKGNLRESVYAVSGSFMLMAFVFFGWIYPVVYDQNPVNKSLALLNENKPLVAYKIYNPGYNFYLNKPVKLFDDTAQLKAFTKIHPDYILISRESLNPELQSIGAKTVFKGKDIFETPVTIIMQHKL
ncbi:ArnT family glycosyltransferase [Solitalea koreensis]|uniref:4-amino-4-deoxy-L-arabinose transferase n=1 Tax=Solitalea koreensis TaxID=543615 RepID=A0A521C995_9SPHI|nr:glycosyltransferase family 39 protein [Solitalea koreensis]SMO56057.1 4-amino-4-deoxy-L-arabinose transferase [Solitalea koreensis]